MAHSRRALLAALLAAPLLARATPGRASTYMFFDEHDEDEQRTPLVLIPSTLSLSGTTTDPWTPTPAPEIVSSLSPHYTYSVTGSLPGPLAIDPHTGVISDPTGGATGLPEGTFAFNYVIVGSKGDTATSHVVRITIVPGTDPAPPPPLPVGPCGLVFC